METKHEHSIPNRVIAKQNEDLNVQSLLARGGGTQPEHSGTAYLRQHNGRRTFGLFLHVHTPDPNIRTVFAFYTTRIRIRVPKRATRTSRDVPTDKGPLWDLQWT